ncbi:MlaD family protein [Flavobacterium sp.]|uniref:MlaD family protein n=1 Tax=Flavobacterium sp. TaxID=239 RepID=UPI00286E2548|nr:MlaD family protein [Flavobacterium sp.]
MKLTREIKTAILVISTILLFIWGYSYLKGRDLLDKYRTFYVQYDNVEGLSPSASVTINGLIVGKVTKITLDKNTGKLVVQLQLKTDFPISKTSTAVIYKPGFIDGKQIAIHPNLQDKSESADGQFLIGRSDLDLTEALKQQLLPLQEKFEKVMRNANDLLVGINNVLDTEGQEDLKKSLAELSQTMEQFHKASSSINTILDVNKGQINGAVSNFNKMSSNFSKISDSLDKADLGKTVVNLQKTLEKVDKMMANLQEGKGTMGKLINDEGLYNNLEKTSKELELLLEDVRLHPTRYVNVSLFGKKNKPYITTVKDTVSK